MNPTSLARAIRRILLELTIVSSRGVRPRRSALEPAGKRNGIASAGPVAAALTGAGWVWACGPALAVSLGDMANEAAGDLETVPGLIAIAFYIIGGRHSSASGLLKLKRHVDHPAADHHRLGADRHPDRGRADRRAR